METSAVNTNRILKTLSTVFYKCLGPSMNLTTCLCVIMINDIDFVLESDSENLKFGLPLRKLVCFTPRVNKIGRK